MTYSENIMRSIHQDRVMQSSIFDAPHFNGPDYIPKLDHARLSTQMGQIKALMMDGKFRTLGEIEAKTGYPQASISAQLRHLKKDRFGGYTLNKQRRTLEGLFEYQVVK